MTHQPLAGRHTPEHHHPVATLDDVRALALALPEAQERPSHDGAAAWNVRGKLFVWERPLRRPDLAALGDAAPTGTVVGVRVADLDAKEAVIAEHEAAFTIPHFDGYPAVLLDLDRVHRDDLAELVTDGWLARAPKRLAKQLAT